MQQTISTVLISRTKGPLRITMRLDPGDFLLGNVISMTPFLTYRKEHQLCLKIVPILAFVKGYTITPLVMDGIVRISLAMSINGDNVMSEMVYEVVIAWKAL